MQRLREIIRKNVAIGTAYFIDAAKRWKICEDIIGIYFECVKCLYNDPKSRARLNIPNFQWYRRSVEGGECAIHCDPHKKVVDTLDNIIERTGIIGDLINYIQIILLTVSILLLFVAQLIYAIFGNMISEIFTWSGILVFLSGIFLSGYKRLLLLDKETFQTVNKNLVVNFENKSYNQVKKERLIAITIWNYSLCQYNTIPTIALLIIFKKVFGRAYNVFRENMILVVAPYMPQYIMNKSRLRILAYLVHYYRHNFWALVRGIRGEDLIVSGPVKE